MKRLTGYRTKQEVADLFGVDDKTIDRRRKTDPSFANWIKVGKRVWFSEEGVQDYFRLVKQRGYL